MRAKAPSQVRVALLLETLDFSRNRPIPVRESQGQDAGHNTLFCWSAQTHSGPKLVRVDEGRGRLLRQTTPVLVFDVSISLRVPDMRVQDARDLRTPLNQRVVKPVLRNVADTYTQSISRLRTSILFNGPARYRPVLEHVR